MATASNEGSSIGTPRYFRDFCFCSGCVGLESIPGSMTGSWCSAPPARSRRTQTRRTPRRGALRLAASTALTPPRTFTTSALQTLQQRCIGASMP
eukprot:1944734-Prymnesium_polylepis.1